MKGLLEIVLESIPHDHELQPEGLVGLLASPVQPKSFLAEVSGLLGQLPNSSQLGEASDER